MIIAQRRIVVVFVLLGIIAAGFPRAQIHTHADAYIGHIHDHSDDFSLTSTHPDEVDEDGIRHAHDITASALMLVPVFPLYVTVNRRAEAAVPPSTAGPPDGLKASLYRPPIA